MGAFSFKLVMGDGGFRCVLGSFLVLSAYNAKYVPVLIVRCSVDKASLNLVLKCIIRESVDSLCRDGADAQYMQYLSKSHITSPQTRKKLI